MHDWAKKDNLEIDVQIADMLSLPYAGASFDCLFAYHVISHTDIIGIRKIMNEIKRVVKPQGEIYITLCSKESWSFAEAGFPKIDENTVSRATIESVTAMIQKSFTILVGLIFGYVASNYEVFTGFWLLGIISAAACVIFISI